MERTAEETASSDLRNQTAAVSHSRILLLFCLFFSICCGLGYPSLNRVDWRIPSRGLDDVSIYAELVIAPPKADLDDHTQYRILVPYLAKPIYRIAKNRIGTWDPIMFGLLVVNSFFVASTVTILLVVICRQVGSYTIALGSALIYLLNFAVPNLRLAGFIDAGEGFFLMLVIWDLGQERYWRLPLWGILGATAKESFVPFMIVFTVSWWLASGGTHRKRAVDAMWMVASWLAALVSLATVQWKITHTYRSPLRFGLDLHHNSAYLSHFLSSFTDRNFWYIFVWLLPLSLFRLRYFPVNWRAATAVTCVTAFALDAYYGGEPGTIGRALFSIAGPLLSASTAHLLFTGWNSKPAGETG